MLISDSHRLLFLHVQRTGGSTIDQGLTRALTTAVPAGDVRRLRNAEPHAPLAQVLELEPGLRSYWTVGFVRNPWSRMLSWWRMIDRYRDGAERGVAGYVDYLARHRFVREVAAEHPDFESFVMRATDSYGRLRMPQARFLSSPTRRADLVGRQETLDQDMRAVFARLDLPYSPLPDVNVDRARPDYHDVYTDAMRDRVAELFELDLRTFDYEY